MNFSIITGNFYLYTDRKYYYFKVLLILFEFKWVQNIKKFINKQKYRKYELKKHYTF